MRLTTGSSSDSDPFLAAAEAVRAALRDVSQPVLAFVFATPGYDLEVLTRALASTLVNVPWAGQQSAGVFTANHFLERGLVVAIISGKDVHAAVGCAGGVDANPREAGTRAVANALEKLGSSAEREAWRTIVLMAEGRQARVDAILRGAVSEAGSLVTWAGGGVGSNLDPALGAEFAHNQVLHDHAVAAVLETVRPAGVGLQHGWQPYGPLLMVTHAKKNVVFEIDFDNAFEVYRRIANHRGDAVTRETFATFAATHPFGIPQADGAMIIRDPLRVDNDGSIHCVGEVPQGALVRVMHGDADSMVASAVAAGAAARTAVDTLVGAIVFDCVTRYTVLGPARRHEELAALRAGIGATIPIVGCLSFGEIGAPGGGVPKYHNKAALVLALPG